MCSSDDTQVSTYVEIKGRYSRHSIRDCKNELGSLLIPFLSETVPGTSSHLKTDRVKTYQKTSNSGSKSRYVQALWRGKEFAGPKPLRHQYILRSGSRI